MPYRAALQSCHYYILCLLLTCLLQTKHHVGLNLFFVGDIYLRIWHSVSLFTVFSSPRWPAILCCIWYLASSPCILLNREVWYWVAFWTVSLCKIQLQQLIFFIPMFSLLGCTGFTFFPFLCYCLDFTTMVRWDFGHNCLVTLLYHG